MEVKYGRDFFAGHAGGSSYSAEQIAPLCIELLNPASVVDVGCGIGTWLCAFHALGIEDVDGYDGNYIDRDQLQIPEEAFHPVDLNEPLAVPRRYDLAICLEVAEHLDAARAVSLIDDLIALAPAVLFSAAIPHQGGTGHVNEQWQDYWADLFVARGYRTVDAIRPRVWEDDQVSEWYAQNALLYLADTVATEIPDSGFPLRVVHPRMHERRARPGSLSLSEVGKHILPSARKLVHEKRRD